MPKLKATPLWMIVLKDVRILEHDADSQYKFNRFWAIFWGGQMFMLPLLIWLAPLLWLKIEFFYVTEASLWANFATHFGAMSAALAAKNTTKTVSAVTNEVVDMSENIEDIHQATEKLNPDLV